MSHSYTYESNAMCLYKLQDHCTFDVTKVEHSCVIDEVLHVVHFHSTVLDVYYLHLWKQYDVFVHIESSLYCRYNLSRTDLWVWWGIFTLFTFTLQYWMYLLTLMKAIWCICGHEKFTVL